jgi:hypothetical protein
MGGGMGSGMGFDHASSMGVGMGGSAVSAADSAERTGLSPSASIEQQQRLAQQLASASAEHQQLRRQLQYGAVEAGLDLTTAAAPVAPVATETSIG